MNQHWPLDLSGADLHSRICSYKPKHENCTIDDRSMLLLYVNIFRLNHAEHPCNHNSGVRTQQLWLVDLPRADLNDGISSYKPKCEKCTIYDGPMQLLCVDILRSNHNENPCHHNSGVRMNQLWPLDLPRTGINWDRAVNH